MPAAPTRREVVAHWVRRRPRRLRRDAPRSGDHAVAGLLLALGLLHSPAAAQTSTSPRPTIEALRIDAPIRLDGVLDEAAWERAPVGSSFTAREPEDDRPAAQQTEFSVVYTENVLYFGIRAHDPEPDAIVAKELQRDSDHGRNDDSLAIVLDTFHDQRNSVTFEVNPLGARTDSLVTDEGKDQNIEWNGVWNATARRTTEGWQAEVAIPFATLRFDPAQSVWGLNVRRVVRRTNEESNWAPIGREIGPRAVSRMYAAHWVSLAGDLTGISGVKPGRRLDVKPFVLASAAEEPRNEASGTIDDIDGGIDLKWGLTKSLTLDLTYNTDFAQVEVDERQVNLTRFPLYFPEKREFFLEGQGIFGFAQGAITRSSQGIDAAGGIFADVNVPRLFYSRKIGLEGGRVVPIVGGARLTGKLGAFDVGALNIHTGDEMVSASDPTNFTVLRVRRDVLRRSSVGAMFTNRSVSRFAPGSSQAYGIDGTFGFFDAVSVITYLARTRVPGPEHRGKDTSYQGKFEYAADRYGLQVDHVVVEDNFQPEVGFLRRDNFRRTLVSGRFSPRSSLASVRQFSLDATVDYIATADENVLETRQNILAFETEFESSDRLTLTVTDNYELLVEPFTPPGSGFSIPVGGYSFADAQISYAIGQQRRINGLMAVRRGKYFDGDLTTVEVTQGRIGVLPQMSVEPTISFNWIDTPYGEFQTNLALARVNYAFSPRMFFSGLLEYNSASDSFASNLRFRWEYTPGSELFLVYTDYHDRGFTDVLRPNRGWDLRNRGFVVKINRLFRP